MAIHRGIQSAIFYYLSCAPCAEARYRKKRKKEAEHGRAEREALYVEMPDVYRHPSPSSTNPHWAVEIAAGPALSHRGRKKHAKEEDSASKRELKSSMTQRSNNSAAPSSVSVNLALDMDGRNDSKMQFQRHQREDEELWGSKSSLALQRLRSGDGSSVTRPPFAHVKDAESYRKVRAPAVNDMHPAVVTKVASREEVSWMMQPPPTADVMSGKERYSRSRSDSGGSSRLSARSAVPLSREVSQRIMAQKLKSGELLPSPTLSRASTALSDHAPKGQGHDRIATDEIDFALVGESPRKTRRIPSPIRVEAMESSQDSAVTVVRDRSQAPTRHHAKRAASRPQLSTINSDSGVPSSGEEERLAATLGPGPKEPHPRQSYGDTTANATDARDEVPRRTPVLSQSEKRKTMHGIPAEDIREQNLYPPTRRGCLPSTDSSEEATLAGSPDLYDSWTSADFALPEWVHEHTKREVPRQRWSMDI